MAFTFNAGEVFHIAEQMERNGASFYAKAAEAAGNEKARRILTALTEMEQQHEKTFADLRSTLSLAESVSITFDPDDEGAAYLNAFIEGEVFDLKSDPWEALTGEESLAEILKLAIGLERDSIVFYLGMRDMVPAKFGKGRIEDIIKEEMGHITVLHKQLMAV